ncbi:MAG: hypothetical protein LBC98_08415 [Prevotellaceae bacterium]|jgi:hypothetical protein|nr:hypothetical protein [Prevotellaceae bacterium]
MANKSRLPTIENKPLTPENEASGRDIFALITADFSLGYHIFEPSFHQ